MIILFAMPDLFAAIISLTVPAFRSFYDSHRNMSFSLISFLSILLM